MGPCGQAGRSKRRILVRRESRIRTRGGDRRGKPQRACSPACGGRLVMNRALIKGNGDLTQLGGPMSWPVILSGVVCVAMLALGFNLLLFRWATVWRPCVF